MIFVSIAVFGSARVGKTCLIRRYVDGGFVEEYTPTEEEYYSKEIELQDETLTIKITDTPGLPEQRMKRDDLLMMASGFIVVYDITKMQTFKDMEHFRGLLLLLKPNCEQIPIVLVGNKCDLEERREVEMDLGLTMSQELGCPFFETSAATGQNVVEAFEMIINETHRMSKMTPANQDKRKKKSCCYLL